jgi:hypothetical protein
MLVQGSRLHSSVITQSSAVVTPCACHLLVRRNILRRQPISDAIGSSGHWMAALSGSGNASKFPGGETVSSAAVSSDGTITVAKNITRLPSLSAPIAISATQEP